MADSVNGSGVRVIGAGLGRTGTTSLEAALKHLGYKVMAVPPSPRLPVSPSPRLPVSPTPAGFHSGHL